MTNSSYEVLDEVLRTPRIVLRRALETATGRRVFLQTAAQSGVDLGHQYTVLQTLTCDGVLAVKERVEAPEGLMLVAGDFPGVALQTWLKDAPLDTARFFELALRWLSILAAVHRHDIVSLAFHPGNILIDPATRDLLLVDFSLALCLTRGAPPVACAEVLGGDLHYLAPEQTGRMNQGVDYRSDFYALGVCFYRILAGTPPFTANDALGLIHCHIAQVPQALHERNPAVPRALSRVVAKLLEKAADERYQSTFGLRADLSDMPAAMARLRTNRGFQTGTARRFQALFDSANDLWTGNRAGGSANGL